MMHISPYPIGMSIRASDTYDHGLVAKYKKHQEAHHSQSGLAYVSNLVRNQLAVDMCFVGIPTFAILCTLADRILSGKEPDLSPFSVLFEVVSAYGNVGLSLGYTGTNTSLSGMLGTGGKFIICVVMIFGRHRGLPHSIDQAIKIPGVELADEVSTEGEREAAQHTA